MTHLCQCGREFEIVPIVAIVAKHRRTRPVCDECRDRVVRENPGLRVTAAGRILPSDARIAAQYEGLDETYATTAAYFGISRSDVLDALKRLKLVTRRKTTFSIVLADGSEVW